MTLVPLGDNALVLTISEVLSEETIGAAHTIADALSHDAPDGTLDVVAAFASVTIFYDPSRIDGFAAFRGAIENQAASAGGTARAQSSRLVEIPICYGGEF